MSAPRETLIGAGVRHLAADHLGTDVAESLTATGSAIGDAYDISTEVAQFGTVAASTGAQLPVSKIGNIFYVVNDGAEALSLYPHSASGTLNGGSAGAAVTVAAGEMAIAIKVTETNWIVKIAVAP